MGPVGLGGVCVGPVGAYMGDLQGGEVMWGAYGGVCVGSRGLGGYVWVLWRGMCGFYRVGGVCGAYGAACIGPRGLGGEICVGLMGRGGCGGLMEGPV